MKKWKMLVWTGKKYENATSDGIIEATSPSDAVRRFGLNDPMYTIRYSRKGYGYFTGRIEVRAPETIAAGIGLDLPLPADFVLLAIE